MISKKCAKPLILAWFFNTVTTIKMGLDDVIFLPMMQRNLAGTRPLACSIL
jgi:hypothetical protein